MSVGATRACDTIDCGTCLPPMVSTVRDVATVDRGGGVICLAIGWAVIFSAGKPWG
jgi:hypothetical protein